MLAITVATAPVFFGGAVDYLTWLTLALQFIPFLAILVLHMIFRSRRKELEHPRLDSIWTLSATAVRGRWAAILRVCALGFGALIVACFLPIVLAGLVGYVDLRWAAGAEVAVILTLPVAVIFMIPVAGEELAWRGYLTTLISRSGFLTTAIVIACLWVVWHLPLTLALAVAGELMPRDVVSKSVDLLLAGVLLAALRYLSSSVWPAVFAHAFFNSLFQMAQYNFIEPLSDLSDSQYFGYMAISWATWLLLDIILVVAVMRRTRGRLKLMIA